MKTKAVAELIHGRLGEDVDLGNIDSVDSYIRQVRDDKDEFTFSLYQNIDKPNPNYRGRGPGFVTPVGVYEFTVTVTKKWIPVEEETPDPEA